MNQFTFLQLNYPQFLNLPIKLLVQYIPTPAPPAFMPVTLWS